MLLKSIVEEKYPYVVEWYTKSHGLLVEQAFSKAKLKLWQNLTCSRKGENFFDKLQQHSIPVFIFSASTDDILEDYLLSWCLLFECQISLQLMNFDDNRVLKKFNGELIHIFNKQDGA